jgi:hypothetical protein
MKPESSNAHETIMVVAIGAIMIYFFVKTLFF